MPKPKGASKEALRREATLAALDDVKVVVRQHGAPAVRSALHMLATEMKKRQRIVELKRQVAELEQEIKQ